MWTQHVFYYAAGTEFELMGGAMRGNRMSDLEWPARRVKEHKRTLAADVASPMTNLPATF
jgi:hypothetical protein